MGNLFIYKVYSLDAKFIKSYLGTIKAKSADDLIPMSLERWPQFNATDFYFMLCC